MYREPDLVLGFAARNGYLDVSKDWDSRNNSKWSVCIKSSRFSCKALGLFINSHNASKSVQKHTQLLCMKRCFLCEKQIEVYNPVISSIFAKPQYFDGHPTLFTEAITAVSRRLLNGVFPPILMLIVVKRAEHASFSHDFVDVMYTTRPSSDGHHPVARARRLPWHMILRPCVFLLQRLYPHSQPGRFQAHFPSSLQTTVLLPILQMCL